MDDIQPGRFISSLAELRRLVAEPHEVSIRKQLSRLDGHCRNFIAHSPLLIIGSQGGGRADVSPRGDAPGFVRIIDDQRLIIPERPGNRRLDTLVNILENPSVSLLFLIPGVVETLRVNGAAALIRDEGPPADPTAEGRRLGVAILVRVEEAFLHCGKALVRARIWDPSQRPASGSLPTLGEMLTDQVAMGLTATEADALYREHYAWTREEIRDDGRSEDDR